MMYLDRLAEILGAKRTPTEKKQDERTLKRLFEEKKAKDEMRKEREGDKATEQEQPKADDATDTPTSNPDEKSGDEKSLKNIVDKIKAMKKPAIFLININLTLMDDSDEGKKVAKESYQDFIKDDAVSDILNSIIPLTTKKGIYSWICDAKQLNDLKNTAFAYNLVHFPDHNNQNTAIEDLTDAEPFKKMDLDLEGVENQSELRQILHEAWKPIAEEIKKTQPKEKEKPKEEGKEEPKEEEEEKPKEEGKEEEEEKEPKEEEEEEKPKEEGKEDEDELNIEDAPKINVGRFRSLQDPHIFILDPRGKVSGYSDFLGPDKPGETEKASKALSKAIKFLVSKKLGETVGEGKTYPVIVYFLSGKTANDLRTELTKIAPNYVLGAIDKDLFDAEDPFTNLKVDGKEITTIKDIPVLLGEMNRVWMASTSESSGNPMPAIQANTSIPLDFFRFVSKVQRPIQLYLGGHPEGVGYEGTIYVLVSEQESNNFIKLIRHFKMPSLFYDRMSANSDIDAAFKTMNPEEVTPANVLVLIGAKAFNPKEIVKITDEELLKSIPKEKQQKITQLDALHMFAREKLGNITKNPGTFIRGKYMIGTHIAQFNADMTICFLWGSHTKHVKIDPKETLKQLPFVKQVITSYL